MLNHLTFPVAILLGFLAGLGVGGGSLLILWLTLVAGMEYDTARIINLCFFLPTALIATLFRQKQGTIQLKKILPAIIAGCAAAAIFTFVGRWLNTSLLQKFFGGLLLIAGVRELFYRPRNAK